MSEAVDFSTQEWKEDLAHWAKRAQPYRGLPKAERGRFDAVCEHYMPLLLEYPEELPTDEHRESALHVIYRAFYPTAATCHRTPASSKNNRARGYVF